MGSIEYIDLTKLDEKNKALLREARRVFDTAYAVVTPYDGSPSRIMDAAGRPIALGWFDRKGNISFRACCPDRLLN